MIEFENTDVNIVRNLIPMRNHMPASAYGLKAISDWFEKIWSNKDYILRVFKDNNLLENLVALKPN